MGMRLLLLLGGDVADEINAFMALAAAAIED
jgi:hypothetical protein